LGAEFLAAIQLIVYAGGTLILIVFGIMLTSKNPFSHLRVELWEMVVGIFIAVVIALLLVFALSQSELPVTTGQGLAPGYDQIKLIGRGLLSGYLLPFEVVAVLLLVVMIGAAYMARQRVRK
jgi:NADH-quinone oxidoreductase subunit J